MFFAERTWVVDRTLSVDVRPDLSCASRIPRMFPWLRGSLKSPVLAMLLVQNHILHEEHSQNEQSLKGNPVIGKACQFGGCVLLSTASLSGKTRWACRFRSDHMVVVSAAIKHVCPLATGRGRALTPLPARRVGFSRGVLYEHCRVVSVYANEP